MCTISLSQPLRVSLFIGNIHLYSASQRILCSLVGKDTLIVYFLPSGYIEQDKNINKRAQSMPFDRESLILKIPYGEWSIKYVLYCVLL